MIESEARPSAARTRCQISTLRQWLGSRAGWVTVVAFLATRAGLLFWYTPNTTDTRIYFRWLSQAAGGRVALVDFPVEYPPFAWWVMHVPGGADRLAYQFNFRALMAVADIASFALLAWIVSTRRASLLTAFGCLYIAAPLILAHELYDRLDMGVLLFVAVTLAAWIASADPAAGEGPEEAEIRSPGVRDARRARAGRAVAAAYVAAGLGTTYKLFPAVVSPFFVLGELFSRTRLRSVVLHVALFLGVTIAPVALTYAYVGSHAFDFLGYQTTRGIEIGTTWASVMWLFSLAGPPVDVTIRFGSWEMTGALEAAVLQAASLATLLVPSLLVAWSLVLGRRFGRERAYVQAVVAFAGVLVVSKVFSPQYLIWTIPALALLAVEACTTTRAFIVAGVCLLVCSVLTTLVYQGGGSGEMIFMRTWIMLALCVRNVIYVSLWICLSGAIARRDWDPVHA